MSNSIVIPVNLEDEQKYNLFIPQVKLLLSREDNLISSLANFTASIKQVFSKISWAGFYLFDGQHLYLGPFQGKPACTKIEIGKGVCGTAAKKLETIIVPDVNQFEGHIVCDSASKSEIVIPLYNKQKFFGVLDLDSESFNAFNDIDKKYLEDIRDYLVKEIFK